MLSKIGLIFYKYTEINLGGRIVNCEDAASSYTKLNNKNWRGISAERT